MFEFQWIPEPVVSVLFAGIAPLVSGMGLAIFLLDFPHSWDWQRSRIFLPWWAGILLFGAALATSIFNNTNYSSIVIATLLFIAGFAAWSFAIMRFDERRRMKLEQSF